MSIVFKARTEEGHTIKVLSELLKNNIKNGYFEIDKERIRFCMMNTNKTILISFCLYADKFNTYVFSSKETLKIGLNLALFNMALKSIKKKDSVEFVIEKDNDGKMSKFNIRSFSKDSDKQEKTSVQIVDLQSIDIDMPDDYDRSIIVGSQFFNKTIKGFGQINGTSISIHRYGSQIVFKCNSGDIIEKESVCGNNDDTVQDIRYEDEFDTITLSRICKITGLSNNLQIYTGQNKPLYLKSSIGNVNIGQIEIYIKSRSIIDKEKEENKLND